MFRANRRRSIGRCGRVAAMLFCLTAAATVHAQDVPVVPAIESVYLTKFAAFVEWPPDARPAGPATLCILNDAQIAGLAELAASKPADSAGPMVVRRLASAAQVPGCQILFIGDTGGTPAAAVLVAPALTVTNQAAEGRKGIINFVIRDDRVRFEIDDSEAARRGLTISSKLLSLAVSVKPRA
jgi:hypothetical protein